MCAVSWMQWCWHTTRIILISTGCYILYTGWKHNVIRLAPSKASSLFLFLCLSISDVLQQLITRTLVPKQLPRPVFKAFISFRYAIKAFSTFSSWTAVRIVLNFRYFFRLLDLHQASFFPLTLCLKVFFSYLLLSQCIRLKFLWNIL